MTDNLPGLAAPPNTGANLGGQVDPLDNPPLILRRGPARPLFLAIFGGVMAALGILGFATGVFRLSGAGPLVGGLFTLTFGALGALGLVSLLSRPYLQLSPEGLVAKEIHRTRRWHWSEFERFEAVRFEANRWAVNFLLAPSITRQPGVSRKLTGVDGIVPHYVTLLHPQDLADLLNAALARWR
jgi:hypothetical protein